MSDIIKARLEVGLLFILLLFAMPHGGMEFDLEFWQNWAVYIHKYGLGNAYNNPEINYHPIVLYILYLYGQLQGSEQLIRENIYLVKYATLLFDFLPIVVLCCFRQRLIRRKIPYMFLLLNIAYLFNTVIWGQVDGIYTNLTFLAIIFAGEKPVLSIWLFTVALLTKLQAIVFLPILFLLLFYSIQNVKQVAAGLFLSIATIFIVLLPFVLAGTAYKFLHVVTHGVGFYHNLSLGAFNMWYLFYHDVFHIMDNGKFIVLTYMQTGLLIFFVLSGITLLPLIARSIQLRFRRDCQRDGEDILQLVTLTCALITLYFFYFNSQMHERYAHPMIIFLFFYGVLSGNYKVYMLASIPYLLSLDKCYPDFFPIHHYKIIFASKVIAIWYTLTLAYAMYEFFRQYKIKDSINEIKGAFKRPLTGS
jgi:Gpi18-like mannosyltransferase